MNPSDVLLIFIVGPIIGLGFGKLLIAILTAIAEKSILAVISIIALINITVFFSL